MNYDSYTDLKFTEDYHLFLFDSVGPIGVLKKAVIYSEIHNCPGMYNLALVTIKTNDSGDPYTDIDEVTNNSDRDKILATVAKTAFIFTDRYPEMKIYFKGWNNVRTRLYQIAISHAYDQLHKDFIIMGNLSESADVYDLKPFERNVNYTGFVVAKNNYNPDFF